MRTYAYVLSLAAGTFSTDAMAQQVCVELAKDIVYNQTRSFSYDELQDINQANLCTEQYKHNASTASLKIEASYKFFNGEVAGTETEIQNAQTKRCEGKFGDFWSKKIRSANARTANADSLKVIRDCLNLNAIGMFPKMDMSTAGDNFTFTLAWHPQVPIDLRLDYAGPTNFKGYQCSAQSGPQGAFKPVSSASDVKTVVPNSGSFMLTCERPVVTKQVDGETLTCYRETLLNVATNGPTAVLKIPETCTPSMPGTRVNAIEQRLAALDDQLKLTKGAISALGSPTTANANSCSVIGALQICWGSAVLAPNPSAPHTAQFDFTFPRPFSAVPTVTNGINFNGSGQNAGVYAFQLTNQHYQGAVNNVFAGAPFSGTTITMQYMAIGTAK